MEYQPPRVDEKLGVVVVETFWVSGDAMSASVR